MYDTLGYLPQLFINQTLGSYVEEHIFQRLDMSSATYSVGKAEEGPIAHGFQISGQDLGQGLDGVKMEVVPFYKRPGDEVQSSGSGGVIGSARDAVCR
jgi:CubicO group peptidase (beta-lactamase class C family)